MSLDRPRLSGWVRYQARSTRYLEARSEVRLDRLDKLMKKIPSFTEPVRVDIGVSFGGPR